MAVVGIDHVQLAMPAGEESKARRFYAGLLGVPEVPKPAHLAARGGAWFEDGGVKIHLGVDPVFRPAQKAHPGLLVTDLTGLLAELRAAGHDVIEVPGREVVGVQEDGFRLRRESEGMRVLLVGPDHESLPFFFWIRALTVTHT